MAVKKNIEEKVTVGGGATGASEVPDPVGGTATLPKSNKNGEARKPGQNPAGTPVGETSTANNTDAVGNDAAKNKASVAMKEEIAALFAGAEVSEEFIEKATTIFEGAVALKVETFKAELQEHYEATLDEEVATIRTSLTEKVDDYLKHTGEKWLEENKVAIESALKSELTEDFITGLKTLFSNHYMEIPSDKIDVLENLAAKVEELEAKLNEATKTEIAKDKIIESFKRNETLDTISTGLSMAQKEKLKTMAESIEAAELSVFKTKVETLKESILGGQYKKVESNVLTESFEEDEEDKTKPIDPRMKKYVDVISRASKTL